MKFTFDRDAMLKEIAIAQEIIANKNALSILSNVSLSAENNTLTIQAVDIRVTFETKIPVDIESEGKTTVYCDKFISILNKLPAGDIEFEQKEGKIVIKPIAKKVSLNLKSMASEKFPEFPSTEGIEYFDIPADEFKFMITQTIFAVSDDQTRYFMNGVFFEKDGDNLVLVATDGRRLSYSAKPLCAGVQELHSAIVPPKILTILLKRAPSEGFISVGMDEKTIYIKFGNYQFTSQLIDGTFPNYRRVIPENQAAYFLVNKHELQEAMSRVGLMVDKKGQKIFFNIAPGVLTIYSQETDLGSAREEIPCRYDGEEVLMALNFMYIDEPLRVTDSDSIRFEFTGEMKAITIKADETADSFHVIMPMQLDS